TDSIITLTDATFTATVEQPGVTLMDFWAPWCMPCRMVAPIIERVGKQYAGKATVARLNVDENPRTAARYRITSIPTVAIFRDGKLVNTLVGVRPERGYAQALDAALKPAAPKSVGTTTTEGRKHQVVVFSTPTCPWCARLKSYLRSKNIAFKDVDVSRDASAAREMVGKSGQMGVPQAWIDDQVVVGFDRARVDSLLHLSA
ncbi:MAG TPA: thioredoxin, partial [Ktedonobacterales bacterium]|nr:thioredoxin [Ktedonobacterales bacterium]